jgi:hypothetical protein
LTPKAFEFTKLFFIFRILISVFLFVGIFPGFSRKSFEKQQAAACRFSKKFHANRKNVLTVTMGEFHFPVFQVLQIPKVLVLSS